MAAQLRAVVPTSSSLSPAFALSATRTRCLAVNKSLSSQSASVHRPRGKLFVNASAYSSALTPTSTVITDSKEVSELTDFGGVGGRSVNGNGGEGRGGGGGGSDHHAENEGNDDSGGGKGFFAALLKGWNDRVTADPQFAFKVLMEQIVGVGASVIGDMACRPNFGLNELDFVFSTLVVGSILNFSLMYMLAPTSVAASTANILPSIFSSCPPGHMFEQGAYTVLDRFGTFVYKGAVFAAVGFGAGLFGTFLSNCLIALRKRMDPTFESQNKAPPTLLNATTWAIHMGVSSNLRYQLINGLEFAMANALPPPAFKASVFSIRAFNNVLGGFSFVTLARLTGSQKEAEKLDSSSFIEKGLEDYKKAKEPPQVAEVSATHQTGYAVAEARVTGGDAAESGGSTKQKDDDGAPF